MGPVNIFFRSRYGQCADQRLDLSNTLTVARGRRPGAAFRHKMLQLVKPSISLISADFTLV
jgi:hypothetical protein